MSNLSNSEAKQEQTSMKRVDKNLVGLEMLLDAGEVEDLLHHLDVVLEGIDHLEIGKSLFW